MAVDPLVGKRFGHIRILELLASGGMGAGYRREAPGQALAGSGVSQVVPSSRIRPRVVRWPSVVVRQILTAGQHPLLAASVTRLMSHMSRRGRAEVQQGPGR